MNTAKTVRIGKTVYTIEDIHTYAKKWHSSDVAMLNSICDKWLKTNDNHCQKPRKAVKTEAKKQTANKSAKKATKKNEKKPVKTAKKVKKSAPKKGTKKTVKKTAKKAKKNTK
jgi:hypothetical protein